MMNKKGLTTLETTVLIIVVVGGLLAMQGYLRRAVQGNWRTNADSFSDEQYQEGASKENVSKLAFINPHITANRLSDNAILGNYDLASGSGIIQIEGWGTYNDDKEHEE